MKKLVLIFVSLFIAVIAAQNVNAQIQNSADASASANIVAPISITKITNLTFGDIVSPQVAGEVTIGFNNTRTSTNEDLNLTPASNSTQPTAAQFTVTGQNGYSYTITLPTAEVTLTSETSEKMTITNFTENATNLIGATEAGEETFQVGATLNVAAQQAVGNYTGKFSVSVNYN